MGMQPTRVGGNSGMRTKKFSIPLFNSLILLLLAAQDNPNTNYYQEYCKLFVANVVLTNQVNPFFENIFVTYY